MLGTGGALRKALPILGEALLVMYGDSYLDTAFAPIIARFRSAGQPALMTVFRDEGLWDSSNVEFDHGVIRRYNKWQRTLAMRHIDWSLGILTAAPLLARRPKEVFDLADTYAELAASGKLAGHEVQERYYEIGSLSGIAEIERHLLSQTTRPLRRILHGKIHCARDEMENRIKECQFNISLPPYRMRNPG